VVGLALAVALAAAAWILGPALRGGAHGTPPAAPSDFRLAPLLVPAEDLVASGIPRDGLRPLREPHAVPPAELDALDAGERGKLLVPDDLVAGIVVAGQARAYPLRVLNWHELALDTLGGRPIVVAFSPLAFGVRAFDREVDGRALDFGVSGLLVDSALVMYDRVETLDASSLWDGLRGRAIAGPAASRSLRLAAIPVSLTTWGAWRRSHPETTVVVPSGDLLKMYRRDPYGSYYRTGKLRFAASPVPPDGEPLPWMTPVAVLDPEGHEPIVVALDSRGFALAALDPADAPGVRFACAAAADRCDVEVDADGAPEVAYALWFAWHAARPETRARLVSPPTTAR